MEDDVVIIAAKRTPIGSMLGSLSTLSAPELGAIAHRAALEQACIHAHEIDEVITGCVLQAGIGQAPGRQAAIKAGVPESVGATTINKMCGSGMKAVMLGFDLIKAKNGRIILASGMESMSNAPYLLAKARQGYRLGHGDLKDHMLLDGLEDAYDPGKLMGAFAEATALEFQFSREQQDAYAMTSMSRALQAQENKAFAEEIVPVTITQHSRTTIVHQDDGPDAKKITKMPQLRAVFQQPGTITAASSSAISDGAASLILMNSKEALQRGLKPLAKIVAHATHAKAPQWFTTAPIDAIKKVLEKAAWSSLDVDLYEINEAFAVVVMAAMEALQLDSKKVNVHGGACALGHPIGASGARILVTLIYALQQQQKKRGVACLCIGGGEATAVALELF